MIFLTFLTALALSAVAGYYSVIGLAAIFPGSFWPIIIMGSTLEGAKLRLRPILMTSFAFILGVIPLLTASGAGSESRKVMGMTVFSGMIVATIIGLLLIASMYVFINRISKRKKQQAVNNQTGKEGHA